MRQRFFFVRLGFLLAVISPTTPRSGTMPAVTRDGRCWDAFANSWFGAFIRRFARHFALASGRMGNDYRHAERLYGVFR